ncbi:DUF935 family protein [Bernardetia sp. Wsw4-3y2]|uniref:phage portal protein family protein n=1 Tax=Bernardetia sp. Wsw4-3y2 TaxID=3127471 RepID=UPI0030D4534F
MYRIKKQTLKKGFFAKSLDYIQNRFLAKNSKQSKSVKSELQRMTESVARKEIPDVLSARRSALDVWFPRRDRLQEVYSNIVSNNAHLKTVMQKRAFFLSNHPFKVVDKNGDEIIEKTKLLQHSWFRRFLKFYTEGISYGYSVIQFFPNPKKEGTFKIENIDRRHIRPEVEQIVLSTYDTEGIAIDSLQEAGVNVLNICDDADEFGLLDLVAMLDILSRHSWAAWDEGEQLMTTFIRVVETAGFKDPETRNLLGQFLEEMGSAAYAVLPSESKLTLHETSRQDFHNVPMMKIKLANELISKLYLGQTMTTDNGSSRSQSETHADEQNEVRENDKENSKDFINDTLFPFLRKAFNFQILEGEYFVWDDERNMYPEDKILIDTPLLQAGYIFTKEYIERTYNVEIEQMPSSQISLPPAAPIPVVEKEKEKQKNTWVKPNIVNAVNSLYSSCCSAVPTNEGFDAPDTEDLINSLIEIIYRDQDAPDFDSDEVKDLIASYSEKLSSGVSEGFGDFDTNDEDFYETLTENVNVFSAAKTESELREMTNLLLDEDGILKTFSKFKADALKIHDTYNVAWLRTEYNHSIGSAQMARKWRDIENSSEALPYLQYETAGDGRVRKSHAKLEGIIRKFDDAFWDKNYPPNGWNDRCTVRSLADGKETDISKIEIPDFGSQFETNIGKTGIIFPSNHPYFNN